MKNYLTRLAALAAAIMFSVWPIQRSSAQGLLNESGTNILAPTLAPPGGYASNPQEYLSVSWSVVENASQIYTYTYTIHNPTGDVLLNNNGTLTSTPEVFEAFSIAFNTGGNAYIPNTQAGGAFEEVNAIDLAWFFGPAIQPSGSATISFESDDAPTEGNANASGASPPAPWSSFGTGGQQLPVPAAVPEPKSAVLFGLSAVLVIPVVVRKNAKNRKN